MIATQPFDMRPYHQTSIDLYQEKMDANPSGLHAGRYFYGPYPPQGPIKTASQARRAARKLWKTSFGKSFFADLPYQVSYDPSAKVWMVLGSTPFEPLICIDGGGTAYLLIDEETGEVLALGINK